MGAGGLMCRAVALPLDAATRHLLDADGMADRVHQRADGSKELRFYWYARPCLLPVHLDGRVRLVRWGTQARRGRLPYGGWTWETTVERGGWANREAEPADVPASHVWAGGVWVRVRHGCRGLVVRDPATTEPVVYLVCRPAGRYYATMTRVGWAPVLIGETV